MTATVLPDNEAMGQFAELTHFLFSQSHFESHHA